MSSLIPVAVVAFFSGAVLIGHAVNALAMVGGGPMAGYLIGLGGVRELFPLFAGAVVASRSGADFASQLGLFNITHQIEALEVMGFSKRIYLAFPRVAASALATPLLVIISAIFGMAGAYGVGLTEYHLNAGDFGEALWHYVAPFDFWVALLKGLLFGIVIGAIASYLGFRTSGGAEGIKKCVNKSIVLSMLFGSFSNLFCTLIFYGKDSF